MKLINLECLKLAPGKKGIIAPDADGYRTVIVGALGVKNNVGQLYVIDEEAKALFSQSSRLQRKIAKGVLYGEWDHPPIDESKSDEWNYDRQLNCDSDRIAIHIRKLWIDENSNIINDGKQIIPIMAEVKPYGPMGYLVEESFNNPSQNTCFSIRAMSADSIRGGQYIKRLREIFCFDAVPEGGIIVADKYTSPACEKFTEKHGFSYIAEQSFQIQMTKEHLIRITDNLTQKKQTYAHESNIDTGTEVLTTLGWNKKDTGAIISARW